MEHSNFQNLYLKHKRLAYKKQSNFYVTLLSKKNADCFNNLDLNLVRKRKMF